MESFGILFLKMELNGKVRFKEAQAHIQYKILQRRNKMGKLLRDCAMLLIIVYFVLDIIITKDDLFRCLMYFGIEFALIYFAIEERKEE